MYAANENKRVLITGGAGFIGSAVVRLIIHSTQWVVINADKLTYAGNLNSLAKARKDSRHIFEQVDICDRDQLDRLLREHQPDAIMHLAAESHVDRSIEGPAEFINTNIVGTYTLLEAAKDYWNGLGDQHKARFRFHHVSTDEVYGDLEPTEPAFAESNAYAPNSPYAASKASGDHLVRAWHKTYGLPVLITNCSNNYGPYQQPEKLIPLAILNALEGKPIPVYGRGDNIRDWLYVEDHALALYQVLTEGCIGQVYNIGGRNEKTNLEVVQSICAYLDSAIPTAAGQYERLIRFVTDRPGHDRRYAINDTRITKELGWQPKENFESGLKKTVQWYLDNPKWVEEARNPAHWEWMQCNYANRGHTK